MGLYLDYVVNKEKLIIYLILSCLKKSYMLNQYKMTLQMMLSIPFLKDEKSDFSKCFFFFQMKIN